ncbi:acyltransferase family protein [Agitococcus lubricus]|uniref:Acyltransferase-like protein n=1 Tax=Agitococcus lubricus TaxID=1077255 RepID=A0A2T5J3A1_9GAMM|nr:acyltransferase [Agitococcus lubricus]PTQ91056.1 acyltransferase-like protein [Agitococcus lubricus]
MALDSTSSERISMLRFPLIVGVVFIHAYEIKVGLSGSSIGVANPAYWVDFCRNFFSQGIARVAVPLFFLLSGYFFFSGFSLSLKSYQQRFKSRINTLLIPFLFWNIFTLFLIGLAQSLPATQSFFSGKGAPISTYQVFDYINAILGLNRYPISYQFWFIRDLMVMVLLAPILYLLLEKLPKITLCILYSLWFFNLWPVYIPSALAFVFFYTGAYLAYSNTNLFSFDRFGTVIPLSYLIILLIDTSTKNYAFNLYIHKIGIMVGICTMLYITKQAVEKKHLKNALLWASSCSFFVFAVHEPLLTVIRKIAYKTIQPDNDFSVISLYFFIPIVVIIISLALYISIKAIAPRFLAIISGGR